LHDEQAGELQPQSNEGGLLKHEPLYVVTPQVCQQNYVASAKSMEADIMVGLVREVADYKSKPMDKRLIALVRV
jgi:hypothetical protein